MTPAGHNMSGLCPAGEQCCKKKNVNIQAAGWKTSRIIDRINNRQIMVSDIPEIQMPKDFLYDLQVFINPAQP